MQDDNNDLFANMPSKPAQPAAASAPAHNGKDVILNLFQWTWDSVAAECTSTVGPAGFGYVQVSPPQESIRGAQWWTSYQPVSYRIESKLKEGIDQATAKKLNKLIRDEGAKSVKSQIQGDELRVSSKSRDDLQDTIALLKGADVEVALQFVNFR